MEANVQPRRRVRAAHAALARIRQHRDLFATRYAAATTPVERFNTAATALRAALAGTKHHRPREVDRHLDALTAQITHLLDELHTAQEHTADRTIRADARRIARNERRTHERRDKHAAA